jgi:hypothetical protein
LQAEYQLTQSKYQYRIYKGKLLPSIYLNAGISPMRNCMTTLVCKKPDGHFMESSGCILESNKPIKI